MLKNNEDVQPIVLALQKALPSGLEQPMRDILNLFEQDTAETETGKKGKYTSWRELKESNRARGSGDRTKRRK